MSRVPTVATGPHRLLPPIPVLRDLPSRRGIARFIATRASAATAAAIALLGAFSAAAPGAYAQDSVRARLDSSAARLERLEARLRRLEAEMAERAGHAAAATTRSGMSVQVRGRVLVNAFTNTRRVNSSGLPTFVRPDDPADPHPRGLAMTIRQTSLGLSVVGARALGGDVVADIDADFYGGQLPSAGGRTFPLVRLRTARARVQWKRTEMLLGQDDPVMAPVNPQSTAALGIPGFASAGNLWLWHPQARFSVQAGDTVRFGVAVAVLAPGTGAPVGSFEVPDFDVAERSGRPFVQARARIAWGDDGRGGEIGVGTHAGWFRTSADSMRRSQAIAGDVLIAVTPWLEIRGEAYDGKGVRSLGNGAIGQLFGAGSHLIRSRGGWAQVNLRPVQTVTVGAGYGADDPHDSDLVATSRLKNEVLSSHIHWRPRGPLIFGVEHRRTRTRYVPRTFANDHVNLAFGFEF